MKTKNEEEELNEKKTNTQKLHSDHTKREENENCTNNKQINYATYYNVYLSRTCACCVCLQHLTMAYNH